MNKNVVSGFGAVVVALAWLPVVCWAQVNSGSNGSDGALNPATNLVINMADHPNGIYQYTSINISNGVTVTFIPNANNAPVIWLVQSNVVINGTVDVSGQSTGNSEGGAGGPGGWAGGSGGSNPTAGQGPGGGNSGTNWITGAGSYGTQGTYRPPDILPGQVYGNTFILPLLGGSGAGGYCCYAYEPKGGGGGGGAILIAASGSVVVGGTIRSVGGYGFMGGSGGGIRIVATRTSGSGSLNASGSAGADTPPYGNGGFGRVRIDTFQNGFGGTIQGVFSQGYQPIIIPVAGQGAQLAVTSVGGVFVSASPTGILTVPDAVLSAQLANPVPVVVGCANIPLGTPITVSVRPASGSTVTAVGYNSAGTQASSTATVLVNIPRGGGIIYATAATGH